MATSTAPIVVVSNRLPVSLRIDDSGWHSHASSGGLVSALAGLQRGSDFKWVGWPGCEIPARFRDEIRASLADDGLIAVPLTDEQEQRFYHGFCNEVLWPLFHYFADKVNFQPDDWSTYVEVNRLFADAILEVAEPGSRVWVHDYHLMLVPELLREARPDLAIGFFLHIPWPSSELYRLLPPRSALLRGLLGADYVAFHTNDYAMHFRTSCMRVLGLESDPDGIRFQGRTVGIGRHPVGIDVEQFSELMESPKARIFRAEFRGRYDGRRLLLSVARLDYSKGIPLMLQAYEALLERRPELARAASLLQVVVPSRLGTREYEYLREEIERQVASINGRFGDPGVTPVDYVYRSLEPEELVALYQVADVAVVTPIRDGMNLVAQEYVFCQRDGAGILVLSEFAGSAHPLQDALIVNPWNIDKTAAAIEQALVMTAEERDERMNPMIDRVGQMDCRVWAEGFLNKLAAAAVRRREEDARRRSLSDGTISALTTRFAEAEHRIVIVDYDGTLIEIKRRPAQAEPTPEIIEVLAELAALPDTEVHVISGRSVEDLDRWLGFLDVYLASEHGTVQRPPGGAWQPLLYFDEAWKPIVRELLSEITKEVLGSSVEEKQHAIAWHYRQADMEYGLWSASGLIMRLENALQSRGLEIVHGHRVVEVRPVGVSKGAYVRHVVSELPPNSFVLCLGDDRTDLDMYDALPLDAVSIHVGEEAESAAWMLDTPSRVRSFLRGLVREVEHCSS